MHLKKTGWPIMIVILIGLIGLGIGLSFNRYFLIQTTYDFVNQSDVLWMGFNSQKVVAFTFDDGPDPSYTPQILATLKKYRVPATFFIEGANVLKYPGLVQAELKDGHTIGNHTFDHPHLAKESVEIIREELERTDRAIREVTGQTPRIFRPPYEELTEAIITASRGLHKQLIMSTITLEHHSVKTPQTKAERVVRLVFPGAIILMHDGRLNRASTVQALPYLIRGLKSRGYRIIPLNKLVGTN